MTVAFLVAALVAAVGAVVIVLWRYHAFKLRHPYTDDDLRNARHDSITRSRHVVAGKVQEYLAPLFPEFISQFNPKDARFVGTPLDFIVFDGLDEGEVKRIVFVEVKTGRAGLVARERLCRDAIQAGRVEYQLIRLPGSGGPIAEPPALTVEELDGSPEAMTPARL